MEESKKKIKVYFHSFVKATLAEYNENRTSQHIKESEWIKKEKRERNP